MSGYATDINLILFLLLIPYLYVMMRVYKGLTLIKPVEPGAVPTLKLSVIIATNKGPSEMEGLLRDLSVQNYNHIDYEVIIADDSGGKWNTSTGPVEVPYPEVKIIPNPGKGKKSALLSAVIAAGGELVITTDDDCRVGPDWLLSIATFYKKNNPDMILCPVELTGKDNLFTRLQQLEFSSLQGVTAGSAAFGDPLMCNGAGLAFRREIYPDKIEHLSSSIPSGDDTFFLHWLKKKGAVISWLESEEAIVRTVAVQGLGAFFRQRSRWASKSVYYNDFSTIVTGAIVLLTSIITGALITGCFLYPEIIPATIVVLLVKSVPDILIIMNRLQFHNKTELLIWFPLVQIIYPFYAIVTFMMGLFHRREW